MRPEMMQRDGSVREVRFYVRDQVMWSEVLAYICGQSDRWTFQLNGEPAELPSSPDRWFERNGQARLITVHVGSVELRSAFLDEHELLFDFMPSVATGDNERVLRLLHTVSKRFGCPVSIRHEHDNVPTAQIGAN